MAIKSIKKNDYYKPFNQFSLVAYKTLGLMDN